MKEYVKIFNGYRHAYGIADWTNAVIDPENGKKKPVYRWNYEELTADIYQAHLEGKLSIGIQPCNENSEVKFGVIDIDPKDLTLAALNLAVGFNALLEKGNEDWIRQSAQRNTRNDRRENKFKQRRRGDFDNNRLEDEMDRFRVEVGHRDRVKPGNLVGAIANEAGLKGRSIGRIRIFENYSLVDLPKQMPDKVFQALKKVKVMNRELQINRAD